MHKISHSKDNMHLHCRCLCSCRSTGGLRHLWMGYSIWCPYSPPNRWTVCPGGFSIFICPGVVLYCSGSRKKSPSSLWLFSAPRTVVLNTLYRHEWAVFWRHTLRVKSPHSKLTSRHAYSAQLKEDQITDSIVFELALSQPERLTNYCLQ